MFHPGPLFPNNIEQSNVVRFRSNYTQLHHEYNIGCFIYILLMVWTYIDDASTRIRQERDERKVENEFHPGPLFPNNIEQSNEY